MEKKSEKWFIKSKMTEISCLPNEVMLHIFTFLPTSDLITAWKASENGISARRRHLATWIQLSLADRRYNLSDDEMDIAAELVTTGHLSEVAMKTLTTRIQSSWSCGGYYPSNAEVRCAAVLAATGHLTRVVSDRVVLDKVNGLIGPLLSRLSCTTLSIKNMQLDQAGTCSGVSRILELENVTGDIGPLLTSVACVWLMLYNTELDQAATSSLVRGLQHGVEKLVLQSGVRLHIQTMVEWEGKGRCDEVYWHDTRNTDREKMKTWAARVGWNKKDYGTYIVMRRNTGIGF